MATNALKGLDVVQTVQAMKGSMTRSVLKLAVALDLLMCTVIGVSGPLDTWTWRSPLPTGSTLNGITYGNGLFVAVGDDQTVVTSTNRTNWTLLPLINRVSVEVALTDVTYGGGLEIFFNF